MCDGDGMGWVQQRFTSHFVVLVQNRVTFRRGLLNFQLIFPSHNCKLPLCKNDCVSSGGGDVVLTSCFGKNHWVRAGLGGEELQYVLKCRLRFNLNAELSSANFSVLAL